MIIDSEDPFITVKNFLDSDPVSLRIYKEGFEMIADGPEIIEPIGLSESRVGELRYFQDSVSSYYK